LQFFLYLKIYQDLYKVKIHNIFNLSYHNVSKQLFYIIAITKCNGSYMIWHLF